jgi:hypothetical protein
LIEAISYDAEAINILVELSERNHTNSTTIMKLGRMILDIPGVGLRGTPNQSRDIGFIRLRGNRTKSFATFVTPDFRGTWTKRSCGTGEIIVQVNINHDRDEVLENPWIENLRFPSQGGGRWHDGRVRSDGKGLQAAIQAVRQGHDSWN